MIRNIGQDLPPYQIAILHTRAARNITAFREKILREHNLTSPEWFVLGYVAAQTKHGGTKVGDIAAVLDVQSTYITGLLRKLETKELVRHQSSNQDRRVRIVTPTKKGTTIAGTVETQLSKQGTAWLHSASKTAVENYLTVLQIFAQGLPEQQA